MTDIPEVYLLQATRKNLEQAKVFQDDMGASFFEHTMYDVKDSLTSILAICDMEDMKQIPQVKKCIQRVTDLLHDVRLYHNNSCFNINHVVINIINVLKKNYKNKVRIDHDITYIKVNTLSDRGHLELLLLYSLIEAVESSQGDLRMRIQLMQKEKDAVVVVRLEDFTFSAVILKEIVEFHNLAAFRMKIGSVEKGTELTIKLPLSFGKQEKEVIPSHESATVTIRQPKKAYVHGAQERT